ncbi:MAG: nitroreductase family protein [Bacteroidales bacterium]
MMRILLKGALCLCLLSLFACKKQQQSENQIAMEANETLETILARTSVRNFTEQPVSAEDLLTMVRAGMAAPTGRDIRPWEFVIITDRATLDSLSAKLPYAKMLEKAPAAIAVLGNTKQSFYWYLDCAAATQNILLTAQSLGLGAVWTTTYPYEDRMKVVADQLCLPDSIQSLCVIPVGYPKGNTKPKDKWNESKVHYNQW